MSAGVSELGLVSAVERHRYFCTLHSGRSTSYFDAHPGRLRGALGTRFTYALGLLTHRCRFETLMFKLCPIPWV